MTTLDNCPFCGGEAVFMITGEFTQSRGVGFHFRIACNACGIKQPKEGTVSVTLENDGALRFVKDDRLDLATLWNTRQSEEVNDEKTRRGY